MLDDHKLKFFREEQEDTRMETTMQLTAKKEAIELDVPKGFFICCNFTTQAANRVKVKLYDDVGNVYLEMERQSTDYLPVTTVCREMKGNQLYLTIDIPASSSIDLRKNQWDIKDTGQGELLARCIVLLAEDYTDRDYNDVQLSITAFQRKG